MCNYIRDKSSLVVDHDRLVPRAGLLRNFAYVVLINEHFCSTILLKRISVEFFGPFRLMSSTRTAHGASTGHNQHLLLMTLGMATPSFFLVYFERPEISKVHHKDRVVVDWLRPS